MADPTTGISPEQLTFEREKWAAEVTARQREIAIKEREQQFREAELQLKRAEQDRSQWTNPLTVAVAGAALVGLSNAVATWWTGRLQRVLEAQRAEQQLSLDQSKAESERILEVIRTGDTEKAATNLGFLLDSGLIFSNILTERLRDYLSKRTPGSGPSLPASGAKFEFDQKIEASLATEIESDLTKFIRFLEEIGFAQDTEVARIQIEDLELPNAYYGKEENTIVIDRRIAKDPYLPRREYMHHVLTSSKPGMDFWTPIGDIESGLADYFCASFANAPILGEQAAGAFQSLGRSYIRRLDNHLVYSKRHLGDATVNRGEIWGGAFWEIRDRLGKDRADRLLFHSWSSMQWPVTELETASEFISALCTSTETSFGKQQTSEVLSVFRSRKFPITI